MKIEEGPIDFSVKSPRSPDSESDSNFSSRNKRHSSEGGKINKDDQYWVRRAKNNAAAKRSRDARRQKEEQTKNENQILREENEKLKYTVLTLQEHIHTCPHSRSWKGREDDFK